MLKCFILCCSLPQAAFLSLLVGPGVATASTRSSLKSISGNSPAMQLAARHCFVLEDPPGDKEPTQSERYVIFYGATVVRQFQSIF